MLEYETKKLLWDYDIPQSLEFVIEYHSQCPLCRNTEVKEWSAQFIAGGVPYDIIMPIMEKWFGFVTTPEYIKAHRKHIKTKFLTDEELQQEFKDQMRLIESDTPKQINEKEALESLIRGLYSRKLYLEKHQGYSKEYIMVTQQLTKAIELKLKMKDELKEPATRIDVKDLIKLPEFGGLNEYREPNVTTGEVWVRNGTKDSIERFVRIEKYRYKIDNRSNIPHTN